jgi:hypothetical protein
MVSASGAGLCAAAGLLSGGAGLRLCAGLSHELLVAASADDAAAQLDAAATDELQLHLQSVNVQLTTLWPL